MFKFRPFCLTLWLIILWLPTTTPSFLSYRYDSVNDSKLESAIALCREARFNGTTYECQLCDDCEELMRRIRLITVEAKKAKKQVTNSFLAVFNSCFHSLFIHIHVHSLSFTVHWGTGGSGGRCRGSHSFKQRHDRLLVWIVEWRPETIHGKTNCGSGEGKRCKCTSVPVSSNGVVLTSVYV